MTKKTEAELKHDAEVKLQQEAFIGDMQVEVQQWLGDMLDRLGPRAKELDMAIGHVGSAIGSGVASAVYELYREKNGVQEMNESQRKCLEIIKNSFISGFDEKYEILKDTVALANAMGLGHKH